MPKGKLDLNSFPYYNLFDLTSFNMKIFQKISAFCLIVVLFSTLSGCRTKTPPPAVDKSERSLVVYGFEDSRDVMEPLIAKYTEKYPNYKITYRGFSNFKEYEKLILNEMAEGGGPDLFAMPNNWFVKNRKKLVAMPSTQGAVSDVRGTFVDVVAKDLVITDDNGIERVYGLPLYVDTLGIYYNKDQFEDKIPSTGRPAITWDGIKSNVIALTKIDQNDPSKFEVSGIGLGLSNVTYGSDVLKSMMLGFGAVFYDDLISKVNLSSPNSKGEYPASDALDLYASFTDPIQRHYSYNSSVGDGLAYPDIDAFVMGKVSMVFGYSTTYNFILNRRNALKSQGAQVIDVDVIKTAYFPQKEDPASSTAKRSVLASYFAYGINRNSKNPEIAWDLLTTLASPDLEKAYFKATNKPTSRRDLIASEKLDPIFGVFVNQVGFADTLPVTDYLEYRSFFTQVIDLVNKKTPLLTAIKTLEANIQATLPGTGYRVPLNEEYYKDLQK